MMFNFLFLFVVVTFCLSYAIPDESCGYVNVDQKNDANIFWWMYGSKSATRDSDPVIIWLQGGPGASSLMGDMCEIGPHDFQCGLKTEGTVIGREYAWNSISNVIFIDQPVGTGFSYVINPKGYTTNEKQIAEELLITLKGIFKKHPSLVKNPLYVFAESYGGKMCSHFAVRLIKAIEDKEVECNFAGIGLGDTWVSPLDCVYSYGPFLRAISHFDENEADYVNNYADKMKEALENEEYAKATDLWGEQQEFMIETTNLNVYNILQHHEQPMDNLTFYANTVLKKKFGIIPDWVKWESENVTVFEDLAEDFMKDSIEQVNEVVKKGKKVIVYSGQLDLIVDVMCTEAWVKKLDVYPKWKDEKKVIRLKDDNCAFRKKYENFEFWWIENAGHMSPQDNAVSSYDMINTILNG